MSKSTIKFCIIIFFAEKEELVNLVIHINNVNGYASSSDTSSSAKTTTNGIHESDENCSNPFDQIKQTCQNLFTSFTDKIASDLNFDLKQTSGGSSNNQNIFTQPRSTQMPPQQQQFGNYGNVGDSYNTNLSSTSLNQQTQPTLNNTTVPITNNFSSSSSGRLSMASSTAVSPVHSVNSMTSPTNSSNIKLTTNNNNNHPIVHTIIKSSSAAQQQQSSLNSGTTFCDCSDDEMITQFKSNYHKRQKSMNDNDPEAGPSGCNNIGAGNNLTGNDEIKQSLDDCSTTSSFEELGAVGGTTTTAASSNDTENWQFINKTMISGDSTNIKCDDHDCDDKTELNVNNTKSFQMENHSNDNTHATTTTTAVETANTNQLQQQLLPLLPPTPAARVRHQLTRRRSDSYVINAAITNSNPLLDSPDDNIAMNNVDGEQISIDTMATSSNRKKSKQSCHKCGKGKGTLRKHVEKFKQQLETSNATETEIREQLQAFLQYLETCNRYSIECSDTESNDDNSTILLHRRRSSLAAAAIVDDGGGDGAIMLENDLSPSLSYRFGDDDGIHVYGINDDISGFSGGELLHHQTKPVICLSDYEL